jgi:predicted transposase YbfD/YdcC
MARSSRLAPVSIKRFFRKLPDPRRRRTRVAYPLLNLVVMAVCAVIAGADTWEEIARFAKVRRDWFAKFLDLPSGNPSHDTFGRVFAALDPMAFQKCLLEWVAALHECTRGQIIAIDGKAAREAMARSGDAGPLCLVSAWATANHVVLGQVAAPAGSNELGALPKLLELLDLEGAIVTVDALGCQKEIVANIVAKKGDYVIAVKGNQEKLQTAVHEAFAHALEGRAPAPTTSSHNRGHGRSETRIVTVIAVPDTFPEKEKWQGLQSLAMVTREYTDTNGRMHSGTRYYISSLQRPSTATIRQAVRAHWSIENQLHWQMDVTFGEDVNRSRKDHSQENLGLFRRVAMSMLKNTAGLDGSVNCKRKQAGWDDAILETIVFGSQLGQT